MDPQRWNAILSRITPLDAEDIDDLTRAFDPRRTPPGRDLFPEIAPAPMPGTAMKRADAVAVGLRVPSPPADAFDRALRLAAFALERDVEVVILSADDTSGFERFGFRAERLPPASAPGASAWEEQVRRFWNIDLVL